MSNRTIQPVDDDATPSDKRLEAVAVMFTLLGDCTRLRILHLLQRREANVSEVCEALQLRQPNASKQLNLLYHAGLLSRRREASQVYYAVRSPMVFSLCSTVCHQLEDSVRQQLEVLTSANSPSPLSKPN